MIEKCKEIATRLHDGQFRRGGEPYISHPQSVVEFLYEEDEVVISAGWLHDTIEDCGVSERDLLEMGVPAPVVELVGVLTHLESETYEDYIKRISKNKQATRIKLADIYCNLVDSPTEKQIKKYNKAKLVLNQK